MKKLLLLSVTFIFSGAILAQTLFTVPEFSDTKKNQHLQFLTKYDVTIGIDFAKSAGKTVEEYASFAGDIHKLTWNRETNFEAFVNGIIFNLTVLAEKVEILNQSAEKVSIKVINFYDGLKNNGTFNNVSYKEYIKYWNVVLSQIADYLNYSGKIEIVEGDILVTLKK